MSFNPFKKKSPQPTGRTKRATRRRRDGGVDRGYTDTTGTFFLLDGTVPADSGYSGDAQPDTTASSSDRGGDYGYTSGPSSRSDYDYRGGDSSGGYSSGGSSSSDSSGYSSGGGGYSGGGSSSDSGSSGGSSDSGSY